VGLPERATQSVLVEVFGGVPPVDGEVDAAAERHRVVDHDDLLVVHGPRGVRPVDGEVHPLAAEPVHHRDGGDASPQALERGQQPQVGSQDVHLEGGPLADQRSQEGTQLVVSGQRLAAGLEDRPGVEVPPDEQDAVLRAQHRRLGVAKVVGRVDDEGEPLGPLEAPARLPGDQEAFAGRVRR
jgi:hypothetical protein